MKSRRLVFAARRFQVKHVTRLRMVTSPLTLSETMQHKAPKSNASRLSQNLEGFRDGVKTGEALGHHPNPCPGRHPVEELKVTLPDTECAMCRPEPMKSLQPRKRFLLALG